jgi:Flp pilus assembly pilin Flp
VRLLRSGRDVADSFVSDERGSVMVEYTLLLFAVAMTCALATVALGVPLVRAYLVREAWLLFPFP